MNKRQYKTWYEKQRVYTKVCTGISFEGLKKVAIKVVDETLGLRGVVLVGTIEEEE